ncbi:MAG TPA: S-methyl-5'-thioadenosine phosphorylase [Caldisericia bacterium]|nr:S-methyl-5'-thioadenosine phosphorylase [Caldisericia bacterium]HRT36666.1 S-methyl-5'-thioadenosine phosphorylase [Caldisericia bacterium]HRU74218.1 S-methyl-5'-thioadenosine phosphorylase [Caldisericia bacterium]
MDKASIGVFGGTGFYKFFDNMEEFVVETPYGSTSTSISIAEIYGKKVAFLPRHGKNHEYPPHKIPYRANLWAMKKLGVERIIAPNACGSLQPHIKVGDFVICDQFVDRTSGRVSTFYDGPITTHIGMAEPYCPELMQIAINNLKKLGYPHHEKGTVVVIEGPRFSTLSESKWFTSMGWEVINMTQYPEVVLARELEMCFLNISVVTDYDVGLVSNGSVEPVSHEMVTKIFDENLEKLKTLIIDIIKDIPDKREKCKCGETLKGARVSGENFISLF